MHRSTKQYKCSFIHYASGQPPVIDVVVLMRQLWRDKAFHNDDVVSSQIKDKVMTQAALANVSYITVLLTNFNEAEEGELLICSVLCQTTSDVNDVRLAWGNRFSLGRA